MKKIFYAIFILILTSCALDKQHTVGETFSSYNYAGKDPIYFYRGIYDGKKLYQLNPSFQMSTQKEFGVLVDDNNKVVMSLSRDDMNRLQGSKIQNNKNIEAMNDSEIISYINSASDSELRLTSEYLSSEMQKMKAKNKYYADTERGKNLSRIQNAVDQRIRNNEIQISNRINNERERERQAQLNEERRVMQEKSDRQRQIDNQKAKQLREQCLGNGQIGVCQSSSQNNVQFLCGQNIVTTLDNLFNQYCYMTDNFHITSTMEVRNNMNRPIKDIVFRCTQYAKSGTALGSSDSTIYDVWNSNEAKIVNLKFIKHQQVASMNCKVSTWK